MNRTQQSGRVLVVLVLLLVASVVAALAAIGSLRAGPRPEIVITPVRPAIGKRTPLTVSVRAGGRGLAGVRVEFQQGERVETLAELRHDPPAPWAFWKEGRATEEIALEVGRETLKGLKGGPATVRVVADRAAAWLRRPAPSVRELELPVRLTPPSLGVLSTATYVNQGGCEAVVYTVGDSCIRDGVRAGERWFPGFPLPGGGKESRFALFAIPYDSADASGVRLVAADDAGNEAELAFVDRFSPRPMRQETLDLSEAFLAKVVPGILSQSPELSDRGGLLENFLAINGDLRGANAATLAELASRSKPAFLWKRPFLPMTNAKIMAAFADRRTYAYHGRTVDRQDHLGIDLAATRAVPVPAANDGVVVLARFFGIYGNAVVVDHGYGLQSLYGHLSSIDVKDGQTVSRGETLGRTGDTGLAGGDHLHFSILLAGLPVSPIEWWDGHWIRDRIARKLGSGFDFQE